MKKLCYVATIPAVVHAFLRAHILAASAHYEVWVVCSADEQHLLVDLPIRLMPMPITRKPSPLSDLLLLLRFWRLFRQEGFDIVHSIMPKTGVIGMLAAWLASVPVRMHTFTGQVWATKHGLPRALLQWLDTLIGILATCVLSDSPSQNDFLVRQRVLAQDKAKVVGAGSICGVDTARFKPDPEARHHLRNTLGIPENAPLVLFVGRLNRDKGMLDLASAFNALEKKHPEAELLLVGAEEDVPFARIQAACSGRLKQLHYLHFTATPELCMAAADIFCLPSYREGFGSTIIEAAACCVPSVASRIYGVTDAVEDGKTGILFPVGDVAALTLALSSLLASDQLRQQMGTAARTRVLALFQSEKVTREMVSLYAHLANAH